jgi:type IV secretion system protein VirB5
MKFRNPLSRSGAAIDRHNTKLMQCAEPSNQKDAPPYTPKNAQDDPYLRARKEWNERYGSYIARARNWRYAAFGSISVSVILAIGVVSLAQESRVEPFVVEVNKLGEAVAVAPATEAAMPNNRVIDATLAEFINRTRMTWPNLAVGQRLSKEAYRYVGAGTQAQQFLNNYLQNKFANQKPGVVKTVQVNSVATIGKNTWQVDWAETETGTSNGTSATKNYQAIIHIVIESPTTEQEILENPLGIYIKTLSWNQVL